VDNVVIGLVLDGIRCPTGWHFRVMTHDFNGFSSVEMILSEVQMESEFEFDKYISVPLFPIVSSMFQTNIPSSWDKLCVRAQSNKGFDKLLCVVGCNGSSLIFTCHDANISFSVGDPSFDPGVISGLVNDLVVRALGVKLWA